VRRKLFTHYFPSGNNVDVYIEVTPGGWTSVRDVYFEWDHFPPSKRDEARYVREVIPRLSLEYARLYGDGPVTAPETLYIRVNGEDED
jgi:hypothetical protein